VKLRENARFPNFPLVILQLPLIIRRSLPCAGSRPFLGTQDFKYGMRTLTETERKLIMDSGIFDAVWYSNRFADVAMVGLDPLEHFLRIGIHAGRDPGPMFDGKFYLSQLNGAREVSVPLIDYLKQGREDRLNPHPSFDASFYLFNNSDVASSEIDPLYHFLHHGLHEGRLGCMEAIDIHGISASISVVIPTYNRSASLPQTVKALFDCAAGLDVEVVIVNDGSSDNTEEVLGRLKEVYPQLTTLTIANQGAGVARNHGASVAKKDIILFIGDDILPASLHFLSAHAKFHQDNPNLGFAVLGKVDWPPDDEFEVTHVMRHIQGLGGEQFGYTDMQPYRTWDWRFFYTCNVSVKRTCVDDWLIQGFSSAFSGCGFEDGEFALRMGKSHGAFPILYITESLGYHFHKHTIESFLRRQRFAGAMAKTLIDLHPEVGMESGFGAVYEALQYRLPQDLPSIRINLSLAESLFGWAKSLEKNGSLGSEKWHKELLHCVFRISVFLGFIENACTPLSNYAGALAYTLDSSCQPLVNILPQARWEEFGFSERAAE
jgi:glycosyltransferase involved in cell wall biosynthesis